MYAYLRARTCTLGMKYSCSTPLHPQRPPFHYLPSTQFLLPSITCPPPSSSSLPLPALHLPPPPFHYLPSTLLLLLPSTTFPPPSPTSVPLPALAAIYPPPSTALHCRPPPLPSISRTSSMTVPSGPFGPPGTRTPLGGMEFVEEFELELEEAVDEGGVLLAFPQPPPCSP